MQDKFYDYLTLLESRAPVDKKADFLAAKELYLKKNAQFEGQWFDRMFGGLGKTAERNDFATKDTEHKGAARTPEMVQKDKAKAEKIQKANQEFDQAAETVTTVAENDPGLVDAWVDGRLKPTIERAMNTDTAFNTAAEVRKGAEATKKAKLKEYAAQDAAAVAKQKKEMGDALAYANEQEQTRANEAKEATERAMAAKAQEKRDALDTKSTERKWDASQSVGATDADVNANAATNASEKFNSVEKPASATQTGAEADNAFDASEDWFASHPEYAALVASANGKGLRAAFESVYGDSSKFSDKDIVMICESCYRRSKK